MVHCRLLYAARWQIYDLGCSKQTLDWGGVRHPERPLLAAATSQFGPVSPLRTRLRARPGLRSFTVTGRRRYRFLYRICKRHADGIMHKEENSLDVVRSHSLLTGNILFTLTLSSICLSPCSLISLGSLLRAPQRSGALKV